MTSESLQPFLLVIIGAAGDLSQRKLLPAIAKLAERKLLPERAAILGVGRDPQMDDDAFRRIAREALARAGLPDAFLGDWCGQCLCYESIGDGQPADYEALGRRIQRVERKRQLPGNRIFYLAVPPVAFPPTIRGLGEAGLAQGPGWTRIVVEKPFGRDLESGQALNALLHRYFAENQIYRIDHYLGKESVQNLLVFRFANPIFESLWNRDRIHSVHITVAEQVGVGARAGYYDKAGVVRDMVQNHLTQLLTLVAMEPPATFTADAVRAEKVKVLHAVSPIEPDDVVLGQYTAGMVDGEEVPGYLDEPDVPPRSTTATYVTLRLEIANWRWQGVPFFLRTGKRMPRRLTRIDVAFNKAPVSMFQHTGNRHPGANRLIMTLQPDEGFLLNFEVKAPGEGIQLTDQQLRFAYSEAFGPLPDAYETLLLDVVDGDQTLFVHAEEAEAAWRLYDPLLDHLPPVHPYPAGTWGPEEADRFLHGYATSWRQP